MSNVWLRIKSLARRATAVVVILIGFLAITEFTLGAIYHWQPLSATYFETFEEPPHFRLRANVSAMQLFEQPVRVTTNSEGLRIVPGAPEGAGVVIHVIGDSQVFGSGLSDDQTIPSRLQVILGSQFKVINHGLPATGPFYYAQEMSEIDAADWVVCIQSEMNDMEDSYSPLSQTCSRCGTLLTDSAEGRALPCFIMRSYSFHLALNLWDRFADRRQPLPLDFNPRAPVAATVLARRIHDLFQPQVQLRGNHLIFGLVPWDGLIVPARRREYSPAVDQPRRLVEWTDDLKIEDVFRQDADRESLFLKNDPHLSARGAEIAAAVVAGEFLKRYHER